MADATPIDPRSSRPVRLLFVVNSLQGGGAEKQVLSLVQHLDLSRFTLGLLYLRRNDQLTDQVPHARLARFACCDARSYLDIGAVRRLATEIDGFQADVVVCTNAWSLLYTSLARTFVRRAFRVVEVFHTTLLQAPKQRLQMRLYRPLFARSDLLIYVCENQRRYWREQGLRARADAVVHNGIDVRQYEDRWSPAEKTVLRQSLGLSAADYVLGLCAMLRPEKAHGDLLRVVASLRARGAPAKALLIGDGPLRAAILEQARALKIEQHVCITGFQSDVRPYVAICDVMTLMSHSETFSIAALEAMALGKPMVMTRIGGAEEQVQVGVNGFLFEPGDVDACVRHSSALLDPLVRRRFSEASRAVVRDHFSLGQMIAAYSARFSQLSAHPADAAPTGEPAQVATRV